MIKYLNKTLKPSMIRSFYYPKEKIFEPGFSLFVGNKNKIEFYINNKPVITLNPFSSIEVINNGSIIANENEISINGNILFNNKYHPEGSRDSILKTNDVILSGNVELLSNKISLDSSIDYKKKKINSTFISDNNKYLPNSIPSKMLFNDGWHQITNNSNYLQSIYYQNNNILEGKMSPIKNIIFNSTPKGELAITIYLTSNASENIIKELKSIGKYVHINNNDMNLCYMNILGFDENKESHLKKLVSIIKCVSPLPSFIEEEVINKLTSFYYPEPYQNIKCRSVNYFFYPVRYYNNLSRWKKIIYKPTYDKIYRTPPLQACINNDYNFIEKFLKENSATTFSNLYDSLGFSGIALAIANNNEKIVELLISYGVIPHDIKINSKNMILLSDQIQSYSMMRILFPYYTPNDISNIIQKSIKSKNIKEFEFILYHSKSLPDINGISFFEYLLKQEIPLEMHKIFLNYYIYRYNTPLPQLNSSTRTDILNLYNEYNIRASKEYSTLNIKDSTFKNGILIENFVSSTKNIISKQKLVSTLTEIEKKEVKEIFLSNFGKLKYNLNLEEYFNKAMSTEFKGATSLIALYYDKETGKICSFITTEIIKDLFHPDVGDFNLFHAKLAGNSLESSVGLTKLGFRNALALAFEKQTYIFMKSIAPGIASGLVDDLHIPFFPNKATISKSFLSHIVNDLAKDKLSINKQVVKSTIPSKLFVSESRDVRTNFPLSFYHNSMTNAVEGTLKERKKEAMPIVIKIDENSSMKTFLKTIRQKHNICLGDFASYITMFNKLTSKNINKSNNKWSALKISRVLHKTNNK